MGPELGALFEKGPGFQWERVKFLKVYIVLPPKLDHIQLRAIQHHEREDMLFKISLI